MPIYEYVCRGCLNEFERVQKISEPPVKTCPSCGSKKVDKKLSLSSFQLKGEGWYLTDYSRKDKEKKEKLKKERLEAPTPSATPKDSPIAKASPPKEGGAKREEK